MIIIANGIRVILASRELSVCKTICLLRLCLDTTKTWPERAMAAQLSLGKLALCESVVRLVSFMSC